MRLKLYRGWWYAVWREDGETKRRALRTQDRDEAAAELARFSQKPKGKTIADIYGAYLKDRGTVRARWAWKPMADTFGPLLPEYVTRELCRFYTKERQKKVGDGTIHTELTFLRAALIWNDKYTKAEVELPSKPPPRDDYLTRPQYQKLLEAAKVPHVRLFIILALSTAGRMTAILELTWDRIDLERGLVHLGDGRKRRKGRATVPMNNTVRAALMSAAEVRTCNHVIEYGGKPIIRIVKAFRAVAHAADLPWCTPHVLRHTAAVWMAEGGTPIREISQYLGHTNSKITEAVYAHYSPGHLSRAAKHLE